MKKIFAIMTVVAFLGFGAANVMAQQAAPVVAEETTTEAVVEEAAPAVEEAPVAEEVAEEKPAKKTRAKKAKVEEVAEPATQE